MCEKNRVSSQLSVQPVRNHLNHSLCSNTRLCSPLELELMIKLRTLLTLFTLVLKAEASDYGMGALHFQRSLWCSANHNALHQLANQSGLCCLKEGFVENDSFERGGLDMGQ